MWIINTEGAGLVDGLVLACDNKKFSGTLCFNTPGASCRFTISPGRIL